MKDPILNGSHYIETTDGKFTVLRGTNRNESCHRCLNHIWPVRCGGGLGSRLKTAFFFEWTSARITRPCSFDVYSTIRINEEGSRSNNR